MHLNLWKTISFSSSGMTRLLLINQGKSYSSTVMQNFKEQDQFSTNHVKLFLPGVSIFSSTFSLFKGTKLSTTRTAQRSLRPRAYRGLNGILAVVRRDGGVPGIAESPESQERFGGKCFSLGRSIKPGNEL